MDELLAEISEAFPPRVLEEWMFGDKQGLWGVYADAAFAAGAYGRAWNSLELAFLEEHGGALRYMNKEAFVAILPAYLGALLHQTQNEMPALVLSQLTPEADREMRFAARVDCLSPRQRRVVARVIQGLAATDRYQRFYREGVEAALATWRPMLD